MRGPTSRSGGPCGGRARGALRRGVAIALALGVPAVTVAAAQEPRPALRLPAAPDPAQDPAEERLAPGERLVTTDGARDETAEGVAFVEAEARRATAFVGELLAIEVRFGLDAAFLRDDAIPIFRRQLDVSVQIEAPWLDDADSAALTRAFAPPPAVGIVSIARNDRVAHARVLPDRVADGRTFRVYALDVRRIERAPGTLRLEAPRLAYSRALGWTDDFVHGRTPTGRRDAFVNGRALEIAIEPLPEAGRPPRASGAVGDFEVDARVAWTGRQAEYLLTIAGEGDLGAALVPDARDFPGLAVLGVLDDQGRARRTVRYDLEVRSPDAREIPAVSFAWFDPRPPGSYRSASTPAFPIPPGARASAADQALGPASAPAATDFGGRVAGLALGAVLIAIAAVFAALLARRHRARRGA